MLMDVPSDSPFSYDRENAPLFFTSPSSDDKIAWRLAVQRVTREYYRLSRTHKVDARTPLSNGMTAGEYAMYILCMNHSRRSNR